MKEAILEPLLRKMRLKQVLPSVLEFANPRLLDVGCGWEARLLKEIEPFIDSGVGIDFKAPDIKTDKIHTFKYMLEPKPELTSTYNFKDSVMGGQNKLIHLPFENEGFDVVTMLAVIEHLSYPIEMLKEIERVLKPSGILLLTAPSHLAKPVLEFLSYRLHIIDEREIRDHKRYYNKRDFFETFSHLDKLEILSHSYFQCGMNNFLIAKKKP